MKKGLKEDLNPSTSGSNIYDMICYYNETDDDEPEHVIGVIKKIEKEIQQTKKDVWVKWKLFGCLVINVLLSAPIYSYGTIYLQQRDFFDAQPALIWPPIIFNSVYLIVTPWLFNTISTPVSRSSRTPHDSSIFSKLTNRSIIVIFTMVLSLGVSMAGFAFTYLEANLIIIITFYSIVGGMSSCIIMGKLFVLINGILNNDRLYMINFIYSFGQAMTQLLFPFVIQILTRWICFNCTMLVIGAMMLHIVPIILIIVKDKVLIRLIHKGTRNIPTTSSNPYEESRYSDTSAIPFNFGVDIKYPSDIFDMDTNWKNPNSFDDEDKGDHFLEELESHRIMNSEGVEILQTILEGDEEMEIKYPGEVKIEGDELSNEAVESIYEEINKKHEQNTQRESKPNPCSVISGFAKKKYHSVTTTICLQIVNPLQRSLKICKFYPSVILKSCDIFSYLLFITLILPNLALKQFRLEDEGRVIYLISLMGFFWIVYALMVLRYHNRLKQNFIHYFHIVGLLGKFFGYLFTNQRYSMNGFIFGLMLISLGHANSFHLQEIMIRNCFHPRKWFYVRGSIYSFSGFLILVYCVVFHVLLVNLKFVNFCNIFVLFNLSGIIVWLLTHYKSIIYIFSRY